MRLLILSLVLGVFIACTQTQSRVVDDEGDNQEPTGADKNGSKPPATQTPAPAPATPSGKTDDTCLGKASLAFDDPECNTCMNTSAGCCEATIGCFKDDAQCAALHTCMLKCGTGGGGNGDGGGGGGGGGKLDGGDAGDGGGGGCKDKCRADHPAAVAKWQTYNTCAAVTCKADCL